MPLRPQVAIADPALIVEPGRRVMTRVRIRNTGRQVAHYRVSVVPGCTPAAWATIPVPDVKLNPGADTDVVVNFEPPHDTQTRAGTFPYGIRVEPGADDGQLPMVGEADLTVGAITAIAVRLSPKSSSGRFNGKHRVLLENTGTEDLQVRLRAFDDDEKLSAAIVPQSVTVPAGGSGEALLRVRSRTPIVMGKRQSLPFHVAYRRRAGNTRATAGPTDGGEVEAVVDGTYEQKPLLAKWMLVLMALLGGLAAFLVWRALQPAEPQPSPPPFAPTAFRAEPAPGDMVLLSWQTDANVDTVRLRSIDCATSEAPLPQVLDGELGEVDVSDAPSRSQPVGPFEQGIPLCFQARSVTADGSVSVWSPEAVNISLGADALPVPTGLTAVPGPEPGTAMVTWDPVEVDGDVRFDLMVDGRSLDPNGIAATSQLVPGLAPGDHEVRVQTMLGGERSAFSEPQVVSIPAVPEPEPDGDGGGGGGEGGGGEGGGGGTEPTTPETTAPSSLPLPESFFAVILPEGGAREPQFAFVVDVARRGDPAVPEDESFPEAELLAVGEDIALPGLPLEDGQRVVIQDGFATLDEVAPRCDAYVELVTRLYEDGQIGPTSGLSVTCQVFPPYEEG